MTDAARLRAQKAYSTDPDYLERMARAEEERPGGVTSALLAGRGNVAHPVSLHVELQLVSDDLPGDREVAG